jgi:type I restriction-modification system DNA methylase subunit
MKTSQIKKLLFSLVEIHSAEKIEVNLLLNYLHKNNVLYSKSSILSEFICINLIDVSLQASMDCIQFSSIKVLENCFELLIPSTDRKLNGAFFTPDYIADFIIADISPSAEDKCFDPSCGSGAFLLRLVNYFKTNYNKSIRDIISNNIYGCDILCYNIRRAKVLLELYAIQYDEYLNDKDFNLFNYNTLTYSWTEEFDVIVGNPPYVKYQDLLESDRVSLQRRWSTIESGTFNLYFAFFELGYSLLKESGKLGYITPNNYFTSLAGKNLRAFFKNERCVSKVIDFKDRKVFDALTYTAITFVSKSKHDYIQFDRIEPTEKSLSDFLSNLNLSNVDIDELATRKWRLLKNDEVINIKKIESIGTPIGSLFNINVGIATLKDEVFFVEDTSSDSKYCIKEFKGQVYKIEKSVTRSVVKISDFTKQAEILNNTRRVIFPYEKVNKKLVVINEEIFKEIFPFCYYYLSLFREELDARDKGKKVFDPFYSWGRTQGMKKHGVKIVNPTFSQRPRFMLVEDQDAFYTNGYGIYAKNDKDLGTSLFKNVNGAIALEENFDVVQKILNSEVMHYYVSKTSVSISGNYPCYQKNFIEKFTLPKLTSGEISYLRSLKDNVAIDNFLINKYQLNLSFPNLVT